MNKVTQNPINKEKKFKQKVFKIEKLLKTSQPGTKKLKFI